VLSPSTKKNDLGYKKDLYERCGVLDYWVVSPKDRTIEVYLLSNGRYTLDNVYISYPEHELEMMTDEEKSKIETEFKTSVIDDLVISVDEVFEDMLDL
jgi:Uma2 family endonuclease